MKKINYIFVVLFAIVAVSFYVSCTDTVYVSNTEITDVEEVTTETIIIDTVTIDSVAPYKYIYLTIDDAPLNGSAYIDSIITIEKVKTSLFSVGCSIDGSHRFREYHQKFEENPFIEIYNHSYSHANHRYAAFYQNPEYVLNDFEKNQTSCNIKYKIARLPGRNLWQLGERKKNYKQTGATSAALLVENGYQVFGWDVEWMYNSKDYSPKQSIEELIIEIEQLFERPTLTFTANHVVLLMHNQMFAKVTAQNDLSLLIQKLKECGYRFEYLRKYPGV